eukprot:2109184-Pleurochrysis_carterae.AAC.2
MQVHKVDSVSLALQIAAASDPRCCADATHDALLQSMCCSLLQVYAPNQVTIYRKAKKLLETHPHAIAIVVAGAEITWSTHRPLESRPADGPPDGNTFKNGEKHFSAILQKIDSHYRQRPVFVFGYSQMMRGLSYRSKRRVPTHFVLQFKGGMSLCKLVQAAGRAMGEQYKQLQSNGFDHVEILTLADDYDVIRNYPGFLEKIKQKMDSGLSLGDSLREQHEGKYAFFNNKELGQKKMQLKPATEDLFKFQRPQQGELPGLDETEFQLGTQGKGLGRAVLEVLLDVSAHSEDEAVTAADILQELMTTNYDRYLGKQAASDAPQVDLKQVRTRLKSLCQPTAKGEAFLFQTRNKNSFRYYINAAGIERLPGRSGDAGADLSVVAAADVEAEHLSTTTLRRLEEARQDDNSAEQQDDNTADHPME